MVEEIKSVTSDVIALGLHFFSVTFVSYHAQSIRYY